MAEPEAAGEVTLDVCQHSAEAALRQAHRADPWRLLDAELVQAVRDAVAAAHKLGRLGTVYVVSPYYGDDRWGEPEAVFTDRDEADRYRSMGDMEVTSLATDSWDGPPPPVERPRRQK